ncbi:hypothetical protein TYRP_004835 [Tyrophagus putrescentiae]|nr:hypothetical protein TYRP_004835 [Tyrophagus putrescentiae]
MFISGRFTSKDILKGLFDNALTGGQKHQFTDKGDSGTDQAVLLVLFRDNKAELKSAPPRYR